MAKPSLAPGKKRYSVSLRQANVERFQALCRDFGMPANTMSNALDDTLHGLCEMFQEAKERGTMNISDIFRLMGKQVELLIEEEKQERKKHAEDKGKTARTN
jgi:hypothetical protein